MIPKIIHYCWFGGNPLNDLAKKCIESWKKYCPDYEIREWNEKNFDIESNAYVKEAYESKKWAFVTDYVRLYVLREFGGIYMDTDAELLGSIDFLLSNAAFSGFEDDTNIPTAIMGSEAHGEWVSYLLTYYDNRHFIKEDGSLDLTTNVVTITNMTKSRYGIECNNTYQKAGGALTLYPKDYFCPKSYETGEITLTDNTVCIHHFSGSWQGGFDKKQYEKQVKYISKYGKEEGMRRFDRSYKVSYAIYYLKKNGVGATLKKICRKLMSALCRLVPVGNVLLFETEGDFCDNGRAFYEYLTENRFNEKYKIIWSVENKNVCKNPPRNVKFVTRNTRRGRLTLKYYTARAKYFFFTHPWKMTEWKPTQTVINFWHGIPLKGGAALGACFDYLCVSSDDTQKWFSDFMGVKKEQFVTVGTPRLDLLFRRRDIGGMMRSFNVGKYEKIILCMPTFMQTKNWSDSSFVNTYCVNVVNNDDELAELNEYLSRRRILLAIKVHHLQDLSFLKKLDMSNIVYLKDEDLAENNIQLYEMVAQTDALLTDYSSIFFDYLLLNKPMGFFVGHMADYSRGFVVENPLEVMPGEKLYTLDDLYRFIDDVACKNDTFEAERKKLLDKVDRYQDSQNCKRIAEWLKL